jgi:hypothetical protein
MLPQHVCNWESCTIGNSVYLHVVNWALVGLHVQCVTNTWCKLVWINFECHYIWQWCWLACHGVQLPQYVCNWENCTIDNGVYIHVVSWALVGLHVQCVTNTWCKLVCIQFACHYIWKWCWLACHGVQFPQYVCNWENCTIDNGVYIHVVNWALVGLHVQCVTNTWCKLLCSQFACHYIWKWC